ncbi:MAG: LamG-like jellyroll fold domain-containing protein [Chroococcidiopsis sp.]
MPDMVFTASRTAGDDVNVPIAIPFTVGGAATFGTDYTVTGANTFTATNGSLTIPSGQVSASMTISTVSNLIFEPDETIVLTPQPQAGIWLAAGGSWSGTIINDDAASTSDPQFASVGLLLHLDTSFADSSSLLLTLNNGGAVISTAQKQWGAGSAQFNGSSQIGLPTNAIFNCGSGDFCWELWLNPATGSSAVQRNILCTGSAGSANGLSLGSNRRLLWWVDGIGNLITGTPAQLTEATWHYVAVSRAGGTTTIWLNNAVYTTFTNNVSYDFSGWLLGSNVFNSRWQGFMDEIRFTAAARTITAAPTAAFPNN